MYMYTVAMDVVYRRSLPSVPIVFMYAPTSGRISVWLPPPKGLLLHNLHSHLVSTWTPPKVFFFTFCPNVHVPSEPYKIDVT